MAVCGIKYINFTTETIKILGVHFFFIIKSQKYQKILQKVPLTGKMF